MFSKRFILFFIIFFFLIQSSFAGINETDLFVENEGWCPNYEIQFRVYNITDYQNKDKVDDDDDDDIFIRNISDANIKVFNGPLDSLPTIVETKTDKEGYFKVTFPSANQYRIEVTPKSGSGYNDYSELFEILECSWIEEENFVNESSNLENYSFDFLSNSLKVSFVESKEIEITEIDVRELTDSDLDNALVEKPSNTIKSIEVASSNVDFSSMELRFKIDNSFDSVKKHNLDVGSLENVNYEVEGDEVVIINAEYGIYFLLSKEEISEGLEGEEIDGLGVGIEEIGGGPEGESVESNQVEEVVESVQNQESKVQENEVASEKKNSTLLPLFMILIGIVVVVGIVLILLKAKKKKTLEVKHEEIHKEEPALNQYSEIYNKTKAYVEQYKSTYGKDQIYRVLSDSKIPKDVLDKVFEEMYK